MPMTLPGVTPEGARKILQTTNRMLMNVPEVSQVFGKAGRSNSATDSAPLSMLETWIELKPKNEWRTGMTPEKLIAEMDRIAVKAMRKRLHSSHGALSSITAKPRLKFRSKLS